MSNQSFSDLRSKQRRERILSRPEARGDRLEGRNKYSIRESTMNATTASEIARLETMTITKVVERFESLFGEKCRSRNKRYLIRRIAWSDNHEWWDDHGPPEAHFDMKICLKQTAWTNGNKKAWISRTTSANESGVPSSFDLRTKAVHWACLIESSRNWDEKTNGSESIIVPRFAKVLSIARRRTSPSNPNWRNRTWMSWKSYMRRLSCPSLIIASNFSAMTVSLG